MAQKKAGAQAAPSDAPASSSTTSTLNICRNKHWRFISQHHGPWLRMELEQLENLAQQNWTKASPRSFDPGVLFDVVKIRKNVDEASSECVRASMGLSYTTTTGRMDYYAGTIPTKQMSKERIFKIRKSATAQLAKAYAVDEVIASVACMQGTSAILDVADVVAKREQKNANAKYVQFFHEKIPSRNVEDHTSTAPLDAVLEATPRADQAPILRTRALTHLLKKEFNEAVADLSLALEINAHQKFKHKPGQQEIELASKMKAQQYAFFKKDLKGNRNSIPPLKEEDQPTGLEAQLLFHRANTYLVLACQSIEAALDGLSEHLAAKAAGELSLEHLDAHDAYFQARRRVKDYAKFALKDYLAFLSRLEYTPGLPHHIVEEIMGRFRDLETGTSKLFEKTGEYDANGKPLLRKTAPENWPDWPLPKLYPASTLFAERPPTDLPPFPQTREARDADVIQRLIGYKEFVTYHPLLEEVLNSLLLTHALLQTSPTEVRRHAYNAARLCFVTCEDPIFQSSRSVAKADFGEILIKNPDWLQLAASWNDLCSPVPMIDADQDAYTSKTVDAYQKYKKRRDEHCSLLDTLSDERVVDDKTFQLAMNARHERAKRTAAAPAGTPAIESAVKTDVPVNKRQSLADGFVVSSTRAQLILRWIAESPLSFGVKKKRPARKKKPATQSISALTESVGSMSVNDDDMVD